MHNPVSTNITQSSHEFGGWRVISVATEAWRGKEPGQKPGAPGSEARAS